MRLEKLEIQGFKSFASKTTLTFPRATSGTQGITAVVGPNGSGKSNVADAIRWVLGEQSLKLLRGKKSEDVIFFGSDKKGQLGLAEVSLYFSNEDGVLPVEYSEVVITRRVYRSGESEYLLNKSKVRLADIALLLAQGNVGQKSYSVIGQGMIDSIINAAPAERRDFFYEAAGVRQYQIKKDNALSKLKETEQNLGQARMMCGELEPKLTFLSRQIERAAQREELERLLHELQVQYFSYQWWRLEDQLTQQKQRTTKLEQDIANQESALTAAQSAVMIREQQTSRENEEKIRTLRRELSDLHGQKNALLKEQTMTETRLQSAYEQSGEQHIGWLLERKQRITEDREVVAQELSDVGEQFTGCLQKLELSNREIQDTQTQIAAARAQLSEYLAHSPTPAATASSEVLVQEIDELLVRAYQEDDVQKVRVLLQQAQERVSALIARHKGEKQPHPHAEEITQTEASIGRLSGELAKQREAQQTDTIQKGVLTHRTEDLRKRLERLEQEYTKIEREYAVASSADSKNRHETLRTQSAQITEKLQAVLMRITPLDTEVRTLEQQEKSANAELFSLQKNITIVQQTLAQVRQQYHTVSLEVARHEAHRQDLFQKICDDFALSLDQSEENIDYRAVIAALWDPALPRELAAPLSQVQGEINRLKQKLERIGFVDDEVMREYEETKERHAFLVTQIDDLTESIEKLHAAIEELDTAIRGQFSDAVGRINTHFAHFFKELFNGGTAQLAIQKKEELIGEEVVAQSHADEIAGIDIYATPPGKKLKSMSVLSGGEKALTAIALICAIIANNPSPFVLLDEVDAALDDANAYRFAHIVTELAARTQFIVITHSQVTMHAARVLYGITMGADGVSTLVSLDFDRAARLLDSTEKAV